MLWQRDGLHSLIYVCRSSNLGSRTPYLGHLAYDRKCRTQIQGTPRHRGSSIDQKNFTHLPQNKFCTGHKGQQLEHRDGGQALGEKMLPCIFCSECERSLSLETSGVLASRYVEHLRTAGAQASGALRRTMDQMRLFESAMQTLEGAAAEVWSLRSEVECLQRRCEEGEQGLSVLCGEIERRHVAMDWPCTSPLRLAKQRLVPAGDACREDVVESIGRLIAMDECREAAEMEAAELRQQLEEAKRQTAAATGGRRGAERALQEFARAAEADRDRLAGQLERARQELSLLERRCARAESQAPVCKQALGAEKGLQIGAGGHGPDSATSENGEGSSVQGGREAEASGGSQRELSEQEPTQDPLCTGPGNLCFRDTRESSMVDGEFRMKSSRGSLNASHLQSRKATSYRQPTECSPSPYSPVFTSNVRSKRNDCTLTVEERAPEAQRIPEQSHRGSCGWLSGQERRSLDNLGDVGKSLLRARFNWSSAACLHSLRCQEESETATDDSTESQPSLEHAKAPSSEEIRNVVCIEDHSKSCCPRSAHVWGTNTSRKHDNAFSPVQDETLEHEASEYTFPHNCDV
uniref:Uncharacterized protein n=1 Tax=Tetraselmis sp. GSL018 TaxID=582737 RepID=A0A061S4C9_9CHLO